MRIRMITSLFYVNWFHDFLCILSYCREQKNIGRSHWGRHGAATQAICRWEPVIPNLRCVHLWFREIPPPTGANSAPTGSWNILKIIWSCLILHPILASHWQSVSICCMSQALNCLRPSCNALISGQTWWYLAGVKRMWPFVGPWR